MKTQPLPDPDTLTLDELMRNFASDDLARTYLESIRWPDGVVCPHCQTMGERIRKIPANPEKKVRAGLYRCLECKKQFTCTVGTIFEDSHIPLRKWLTAWYLMATSKKGVSGLQIQRMLDLGSYRSAHFMMHRIRYALKEEDVSEKLSGVVEADESFVGGQAIGKGKANARKNKIAVLTIVERGGRKRSQVLERVTSSTLKAAIRENVLICSRLMTDQHPGYTGLAPKYDHETVKHSAKEFIRGDVHVNTVESSFSLLKRGVVGTFHSVSKKYLPLYLAEFDHRWNHRKDSDGLRTFAALRKAEGKRMTYKPTKSKKGGGR
jgi:transposase-like protein